MQPPPRARKLAPNEPTGSPILSPAALAGLQLPTLSSIYAERIPRICRNNSGGALPIGSLVQLDTTVTTDLAVTTSTTQDAAGSFGFTLEDIPSGQSGLVAFVGEVEGRTLSGTNITDYVRQSTTAGVAGNTTSPTSGTIGRAIGTRNSTTGRQLILLLPRPVTADTTAPRFATAFVSGTRLDMIYDEQLDTTSTPATTDLTVNVNGVGRTINTVSVNGSVVRLTLASAVVSSDSVTVAYTAGTNPIRDLASNNAANLAAQTAINTTAVVSTTSALSIYGDGSDGAVTIAANASLTTDTYYTNLTVNSGVTLTSAGYRIFCTGTLTLTGTIANNGSTGGNGSNATTNVGAAGGAQGTNASTGSMGNPGNQTFTGTGSAGGSGQTGAGSNGAASGNPVDAANSAGGTAGNTGAQGGTGGNGPSGNGGTGGSPGTAGTRTATLLAFRTLVNICLMRLISVITVVIPHVGGWNSPGTGGGGGGGDGTNAGGGGGGGGGNGGHGGFVAVFARTITGAGNLQANGGQGGNAGNGASRSVGNVGGGAGGSGGSGGKAGLIAVVSASNSGWTGTGQVNGGSGGALGTGGTPAGTGTAGANGLAGSTGASGLFLNLLDAA